MQVIACTIVLPQKCWEIIFGHLDPTFLELFYCPTSEHHTWVSVQHANLRTHPFVSLLNVATDSTGQRYWARTGWFRPIWVFELPGGIGGDRVATLGFGVA